MVVEREIMVEVLEMIVAKQFYLTIKTEKVPIFKKLLIHSAQKMTIFGQ